MDSKLKSFGRKVAKTVAVIMAFSVGSVVLPIFFGVTTPPEPAMVSILSAGAVYKLLNRKNQNKRWNKFVNGMMIVAAIVLVSQPVAFLISILIFP